MIFLPVRWATSLYVLFLVSFSPVLSGDDAKDDSFLFLDFFPFHRVHTHICLRYVLYPTHFYLTSLHITIHLLILLTSPLPSHQPHPIYLHLSLSSVLFTSRFSHPTRHVSRRRYACTILTSTSYNTTDTDNTFTYNYSHHTPLLSSLTSRQVF